MIVSELIEKLKSANPRAIVNVFNNPIVGSIREMETTKASWKPVDHIVDLGENIYLYDSHY